MTVSAESPPDQLERWWNSRNRICSFLKSGEFWIVSEGYVEGLSNEEVTLKSSTGASLRVFFAGTQLEPGMVGSNLSPVDCLTIIFGSGTYCYLINLDVEDEWPEFIDS